MTELGDEWHVCKTVLCVSLIVPCFLSPRLSSVETAKLNSFVFYDASCLRLLFLRLPRHVF